MKVVLKELRETRIGLNLIEKASIYQKSKLLQKTKPENTKLIFIFLKSIETAKRNVSER